MADDPTFEDIRAIHYMKLDYGLGCGVYPQGLARVSRVDRVTCAACLEFLEAEGAS